jgi:murein DD-endopeptidase MepM/ murein hydrolase activator NlpD
LQIIVISDRLAKAKTVTLTTRHVFASALVGGVMLAGLTIGLYALTFRLAGEVKIPFLHEIVAAAQQGETQKASEFVQQNLNAMAVKLGEMQAQLTRLDALGERLSTVVGIKPQEFRLNEPPGLGGAQSTSFPPQNLSMEEFNRKLEMLSRQMDNRTDLLGVLEAQMFEQAVRKKLLPTMLPVNASFNSSTFGVRIDPFTGQNTMHEGIDFMVDPGTSVVSAAGGVVQFAGMHPQYGYMIDIDHGNDLVTRYAHCSKLLVKEGDFVQRGHKIALSGATGRATGPHLHFEVRYRGSAQNPGRFLYATAPPARLAKAGR